MDNAACEIKIEVVVVITTPLSRNGDTARTAIQVHAVNLIEIRPGEAVKDCDF